MPADITIFDPEKKHTVVAANFMSKSRNTPFDGWTLKGQVMATIVDGQIVFEGSD